MTEERKSFMMYVNYAKQFRLLNMEQRGALITAIFEYIENGIVLSSLDALTEMAFSCMQDTFDRDYQTYIQKCEKNSENGKKGGRPKKSEKTERFFEKIWGYDSDAELNVVWVYISYLRKKLSALNANIQIKVTRNAGYSLEETL